MALRGRGRSILHGPAQAKRIQCDKMTTSNSPSRLSASLQRFRLDGVHDTGITVGDGSYATVLQYDFRGTQVRRKKDPQPALQTRLTRSKS